MLTDTQGMPKMSLLIIFLFIIFMEGSHASEKVIWEVVSMMRIVYAESLKYLYGNSRRLVNEDFVQEQVPNSNPAHYEFLGNPKAHALGLGTWDMGKYLAVKQMV
jgi:hypothetical protein